MTRPLLIIMNLFLMLSSIKLDYQFLFDAGEICYESPYGMLPTETVPAKLFTA